MQRETPHQVDKAAFPTCNLRLRAAVEEQAPVDQPVEIAGKIDAVIE